MDQRALETALSDLAIPIIRFYPSIGSTNTEALQWAEQGAPDLALVIADEQIAGRGRSGKRWFTPPGCALAFSLVLYIRQEEQSLLTRYSALGALAVQQTIKNKYQLPALIKWPNDVLIKGGKTAGILVEARWSDAQLTNLVLGVGINIATASTGGIVLDASESPYPATSLATHLSHPIDRLQVLHDCLAELIYWRSRLGSDELLQTWESNLAYRGEWIRISHSRKTQAETTALEIDSGNSSAEEVQIMSLEPDGALIVRTLSGKLMTIYDGVIRQKPI